MDAAERRFRACVDRLKRDLTTIVLRSIDDMVDEALSEARAAEASEIRDAQAASRDGNGSARRRAGKRRARGEGSRARTREQANGLDAAAGSNLSAADVAAIARASQLELDLSLLGPKRKPSLTRVRPDSVLGAELAAQAEVTEQGVEAGAGASMARESAPVRVPTERPLFVHKRARDGQIHALRRNGDGALQAAEGRSDATAAERG